MRLTRFRAADGTLAVALPSLRPRARAAALSTDVDRRRGSVAATPSPFSLCADDYGFSEGVGAAIRTLIAAGRLSATSCLVTSPLWRAEADRLRACSGRAEVGLHLNLTLGAPLGPMPRLAPDGRLPSLERLILLALCGWIDRTEVESEIERQFERFEVGFGRLPEFIDGHEHVHQFPIVRDAVIAVFVRRLQDTGAWMRYPAMSGRDLWCHRTALSGASGIRLLGLGFESRARARGIAGNTAFRGVRRFRDEPPYARLFTRFLEDLPTGALVMCHPGIGDTAEPPTRHPGAARVEEFRFLLSDAFPALLQARNLRLAPLRQALPGPSRMPAHG